MTLVYKRIKRNIRFCFAWFGFGVACIHIFGYFRLIDDHDIVWRTTQLVPYLIGGLLYLICNTIHDVYIAQKSSAP